MRLLLLGSFIILVYGFDLVLETATAADSLATAIGVRLQAFMSRQHLHADWAFLPRGQFPKRADILLGAEIELASSFIKLLLDALANLLVLLAVTVLTILVTIPNALASVALLEGIAYLSARRTHFGWGIFGGGYGIIIPLPFPGGRFAERHGAKLLSSRRCTALFR